MQVYKLALGQSTNTVVGRVPTSGSSFIATVAAAGVKSLCLRRKHSSLFASGMHVVGRNDAIDKEEGHSSLKVEVMKPGLAVRIWGLGRIQGTQEGTDHR